MYVTAVRDGRLRVRPHFRSRSHSYEDDDVRVPDRRRRSPLFSLPCLCITYLAATLEKHLKSGARVIFLRKSMYA